MILEYPLNKNWTKLVTITPQSVTNMPSSRREGKCLSCLFTQLNVFCFHYLRKAMVKLTRKKSSYLAKNQRWRIFHKGKIRASWLNSLFVSSGKINFEPELVVTNSRCLLEKRSELSFRCPLKQNQQPEVKKKFHCSFSETRNTRICSGKDRMRHVFLSRSHAIEIRIIPNKNEDISSQFLLQYEGEFNRMTVLVLANCIITNKGWYPLLL